jgi:hypothetical protein
VCVCLLVRACAWLGASACLDVCVRMWVCMCMCVVACLDTEFGTICYQFQPGPQNVKKRHPTQMQNQMPRAGHVASPHAGCGLLMMILVRCWMLAQFTAAQRSTQSGECDGVCLHEVPGSSDRQSGRAICMLQHVRKLSRARNKQTASHCWLEVCQCC